MTTDVQPAAPSALGAGASPAEAFSTPVDGVEVVGSLSPSRVGDFLTCPLLYRFRTIDKLPEPPSPAAARGTLVHKVLEDLFDLPATERTPAAATGMLEPTWADLVATEPELAAMFPDDDGLGTWLASCRDVLGRYFTLEDPRLLEPAERELYVETITDSKVLLRGFIDRLDVAPDGSIRVVDYKTARSVSERGEAKALFQLKFYGLVVWRMRGVIPKRLQLMYLGNGEIVHYEPDEADLLATERKLEAVWRAIDRARTAGDWRPRRGPLCGWCNHQALCPEYGGTPPPLPTEVDQVVASAEASAASG